TVSTDLNANNQLDPTDTPIAGATVQLYQANGTTLLGTTTTAADGTYLFDGANVAGGPLAAGTDVLAETPPAGYPRSECARWDHGRSLRRPPRRRLGTKRRDPVRA